MAADRYLRFDVRRPRVGVRFCGLSAFGRSFIQQIVSSS